MEQSSTPLTSLLQRQNLPENSQDLSRCFNIQKLSPPHQAYKFNSSEIQRLPPNATIARMSNGAPLYLLKEEGEPIYCLFRTASFTADPSGTWRFIKFENNQEKDITRGRIADEENYTTFVSNEELQKFAERFEALSNAAAPAKKEAEFVFPTLPQPLQSIVEKNPGALQKLRKIDTPQLQEIFRYPGLTASFLQNPQKLPEGLSYAFDEEGCALLMFKHLDQHHGQLACVFWFYKDDIIENSWDIKFYREPNTVDLPSSVDWLLTKQTLYLVSGNPNDASFQERLSQETRLDPSVQILAETFIRAFTAAITGQQPIPIDKSLDTRVKELLPPEEPKPIQPPSRPGSATPVTTNTTTGPASIPPPPSPEEPRKGQGQIAKLSWDHRWDGWRYKHPWLFKGVLTLVTIFVYLLYQGIRWALGGKDEPIQEKTLAFNSDLLKTLEAANYAVEKNGDELRVYGTADSLEAVPSLSGAR